MRSAATVAARVRVALVAGSVIALLAAGFASRLSGAVRENAGDPEALATVVRDLGILLVIGALVGGFAVALMASGIAVAPLGAITRITRAMRRDLGIRTHVAGEDEIGRLGQALDELAAWLGREKASLEEDRNRLVAILESMAEGVLVTSPGEQRESVVVLANAALRQMFLLDRAILGRSPIEVIRVAGLDEILARAAESESGASGELELGGMRPRRVFVRAAPMKTKERDQRPALVAVFNDVTELRRLESVRRDFVANVSHELRTPIMAISSATETLQAGALGDPQTARDFVDIIARHAVRLRSLVEDLLELSKIEAKEWRFELAAVDPAERARVAAEAVAVAAERRNAQIEIKLDPALGHVRADPRALEQILVNLLDNAVKYGGSKPQVELAGRREGERVILTVRDRGPGIEPRHLPRIFERFYRIDAGRSRAVGGTGLGLSIVKHLVEGMGGSIEVESTPGVGTTFVVSLRRERPDATSPDVTQSGEA
jgi:two-component system phosphate regulon sensor histidine kinase PhoR